MEKLKKFSWRKNIVTLILIAVGLCFIVFSGLSNCFSSLKTMMVKIKEPSNYNFPNYNNLLKNQVKDGLVNYKALSKSQELTKALKELESISPVKLSEPDKLAFWINAYNLLAIKNIVDQYPVDSIESIGRSTRTKQFVIGGKLLTLSEIEKGELNDLIKKNNPDAVFLLCPGAIGYPDLADHIIEGANIDIEGQNALHNFALSAKSHKWIKTKRLFRISRFFLWNENILKKKYTSGFALVNDCLPTIEKVDFKDNHMKYGYFPDFDFRLNDQALLSQNKEQ